MSDAPGSFAARMRAEAAHIARSLTSFGPSRGDRLPLAVQAGVAMAVPILALAAAGRNDIALLAANGAFAVIYGGSLSPRERARFAPIMALALTACAALGTAAASLGTGAVLVGVLLLTIASAALAAWIRLGPPGPVFFVLVFGLSAQITARHAGAPGVDPWLYLSVVAASSAFACLVVVAPLVRARHRREPARPLREIFAPRWTDVAATLTGRAAVVALVGVAAAIVVDPQRSYWIVCAGVAVVGLPVTRREAATRGIHRAVGTIGGAAVYLALAFLPLPVWALALLLCALQVAIELVVVRHYALALVFITPLVLLIIGAATGEDATGPLALERVVDTLVGAAVGTVAALLVRPRRA